MHKVIFEQLYTQVTYNTRKYFSPASMYNEMQQMRLEFKHS